ncbi:MAG: hypothetical protein WC554_00455 [Clostridia bacterium]
MITKPTNHFEVEDYEVHFLQNAPVTVCVIRSLTDRSQKYTGISVCHPSDVWDEATGRHKAMKDALENSKQNVTGSAPFDVKGAAWMIIFSVKVKGNFPVKEIQRAYWEHYKNIESKRKSLLLKAFPPSNCSDMGKMDVENMLCRKDHKESE